MNMPVFSYKFKYYFSSFNYWKLTLSLNEQLCYIKTSSKFTPKLQNPFCGLLHFRHLTLAPFRYGLKWTFRIWILMFYALGSSPDSPLISLVLLNERGGSTTVNKFKIFPSTAESTETLDLNLCLPNWKLS